MIYLQKGGLSSRWPFIRGSAVLVLKVYAALKFLEMRTDKKAGLSAVAFR